MILRIVFIAVFLALFGSFGAAQTIEQTQTSNLSSKPLAILSKPLANYTDQAKKKNLSGIVRLRIVFKADGTIGSIEDATKKNRKKMKKYGLTAQAMEAAKKIKFTPATENGQPKTVTKLVEYTFTSY